MAKEDPIEVWIRVVVLVRNGQIHYTLKECQIWNKRSDFKSERKRGQR